MSSHRDRVPAAAISVTRPAICADHLRYPSRRTEMTTLRSFPSGAWERDRIENEALLFDGFPRSVRDTLENRQIDLQRLNPFIQRAKQRGLTLHGIQKCVGLGD